MAEVDHAAVSRHRATIIGCLKESDPSIRRRALEVVFALVNERNVEELVRELLNYLVGLITPCEADAGGGQRAAGADQQGDVTGIIFANSIYDEQNLAIIDYDNAYSASLIENVKRIREEDSWKYMK